MGDTLWENICKRIGYRIIEIMPTVVNNGYNRFGLNVPPHIDLPDFGTQDLLQPVAVCPCDFDQMILYNSEGNATLNGYNASIQRLDRTERRDKITFKKRDVRMVMPFNLHHVTIISNWNLNQGCVGGPLGKESQHITTTKQGKMRITFSEIQLTVIIDLDKGNGAATNVSIDVDENAASWAKQPTEYMIYDDDMNKEQRDTLMSFMTQVFGPQIVRDTTCTTLEGTKVADTIKSVINQGFNHLKEVMSNGF